MVWLCLYALFLNQLAQQFDRLLHPLHGDVLIRPMEGVAAGAQVGAGQPHEAQPCAVGAASDGFHHRRQPHRFRSGLGVVDEVDVMLDDFRHVLVLILDAPLHGACAVPLVQHLGRVEHGLLPHLEPGGTVVTDSITSDGLKEYIETTLGGKHHRFKRGYKNVINEALRLNQEGVDCPLAIETSGHAAMRENHFLDDGAYLVTKILIKMASLRKEGKDLTSLLAPLREPVEAAEVRLPITEENFRACGEALIAALEAYAQEQNWAIAPDNREGIRVSFPKGEGEGWFLLRLSVHDPILPINLESDCAGGVAVIGKKLLQFLEAHKEGVDLSPLENFLNAPQA